MRKGLRKILALATSVVMMSSAVAFTSVSAVAASTVNLTSSGAWFETAYAEWSSYPSASDYNVYYKQSGESKYTQADEELVRGNRVDIPGLKGNVNYEIKVVPVVKGSEVEAGATAFSVTPKAHDRSGYAFFNGSTTGGYNLDGTPKANANIVYVTNENKDTVTLNGYKGIGAILSQAARKNDKNPLIVRFIGSVGVPNGASSYPDNMLTVKQANGVTIEGIGYDANIDKWGFCFQRSSNLEVRNLDFYWYPEDALGFELNCERVWVHNNNIRKGHQDNPKEADKANGDGGSDFKYTNYVTVSYNHYEGAKKTALLGLKEKSTYRLTFHHNYFDNTGSRTPRVRFFDVHVYNNYYKGVGTYGIGASVDSKIFSEANYFENTNRPMVISMQGNGGTTFSRENGGTIKAYGNKIVNCTKYTPGVDYYEASSRDEKISFTANQGGCTYNNFDTDKSVFYVGEYKAESADAAKATVLKYAGRMKQASGNNSDSVEVTTSKTTEATTETTTKATTTEKATETTTKTTTTEKATETTTKATTTETTTEATTQAPNGAVKMGSYALNSSTVKDKNCVMNNISINVRSVESDCVKLRNDNAITFTVDKACKLTVEATNKKYILSGNGSEITGSGTQSFDLAKGSYTIKGKESGGNTNLSKLTFEEKQVVTTETTTETTTKATTTETTTKATTTTTETTTKATTTTTETTTEATTQAPASDGVAMGSYSLNASTVPSKNCSVNGFDFKLRSVEDDLVKLRSDNSISFTVGQDCTLTISADGKGVAVMGNGMNESFDAGEIQVQLSAGSYTITGAESGSNTSIYSITLR